jgi:hypothetical protein
VKGRDQGCAEQEGEDGGEGFGPGEVWGGDGEVVGAEGEEDCVSCLVGDVVLVYVLVPFIEC